VLKILRFLRFNPTGKDSLSERSTISGTRIGYYKKTPAWTIKVVSSSDEDDDLDT